MQKYCDVSSLAFTRILANNQEFDPLRSQHPRKTFEPRHNKKGFREFPTRPDTNRPAQPQKLAGLEILAIESRDIILPKQ